MRSRLITLLTIAGVVAASAGVAAAAGPTPGFAEAGVVSPNGLVRYVAVATRRQDLRQGRPRL